VDACAAEEEKVEAMGEVGRRSRLAKWGAVQRGGERGGEGQNVGDQFPLGVPSPSDRLETLEHTTHPKGYFVVLFNINTYLWFLTIFVELNCSKWFSGLGSRY